MNWDKFKYGLLIDCKLKSVCIGFALAAPLFWLADFMVDYARISETTFHHMLRGVSIFCLIMLSFYLPFSKKFGNVTLRHLKNYYGSEQHDKDIYMWLWECYFLFFTAAMLAVVL